MNEWNAFIHSLKCIDIFWLIDCYWFNWMNEYEWIWAMPLDSLDWVVYLVRNIKFLFDSKNILFLIDGL